MKGWKSTGATRKTRTRIARNQASRIFLSIPERKVSPVFVFDRSRPRSSLLEHQHKAPFSPIRGKPNYGIPTLALFRIARVQTTGTHGSAISQPDCSALGATNDTAKDDGPARKFNRSHGSLRKGLSSNPSSSSNTCQLQTLQPRRKRQPAPDRTRSTTFDWDRLGDRHRGKRRSLVLRSFDQQCRPHGHQQMEEASDRGEIRPDSKTRKERSSTIVLNGPKKPKTSANASNKRMPPG